MFRTIGTLRPAMWPSFLLSAFWKREISHTLGKFTPHCGRPVLISVLDDPKSLQIRRTDHRRDPALQPSFRGRPLLLRPPQRRIATGILFRDSGNTAAKTGADFL